MNSHRRSLGRLWRVGSRLLELNCALPLASALLCLTTLRGRSAFPITAEAANEIATQDVERKQSTRLVLGCELGVFCSPAEGLDFRMITKDEREVRDGSICHPCSQVEAPSTAGHFAVYAAQKSGAERIEGRLQRLRVASGPQSDAVRPSLPVSSSPPIQPYARQLVPMCCSTNSAHRVEESSDAAQHGSTPKVSLSPAVFGEKAEGLTTVRSLVAADAPIASATAPAHQAIGSAQRDESGEVLHAVWASTHGTDEETPFTDHVESDEALFQAESQNHGATTESAKEDEIVSSQRYSCRNDPCAFVPVPVVTPSAIPVAPLYPVNTVAPQPFSFAPVPYEGYTTTTYNSWPTTYQPFTYYGSFANQNNWFTSAQGSTVQTGLYGGPTNGWTGMGYPPILY